MGNHLLQDLPVLVGPEGGVCVVHMKPMSESCDLILVVVEPKTRRTIIGFIQPKFLSKSELEWKDVEEEVSKCILMKESIAEALLNYDKESKWENREIHFYFELVYNGKLGDRVKSKDNVGAGGNPGQSIAKFVESPRSEVHSMPFYHTTIERAAGVEEVTALAMCRFAS